MHMFSQMSCGMEGADLLVYRSMLGIELGSPDSHSTLLATRPRFLWASSPFQGI